MSDANPVSPQVDRSPETPVHPRPATPASPEAKKSRSDLSARLLTAAILVPTFLYVITVGGLWYLGTIILIVVLGQREIYVLLEDKGAHPWLASVWWPARPYPWWPIWEPSTTPPS